MSTPSARPCRQAYAQSDYAKVWPKPVMLDRINATR
jgi:hypothetical protein